MGNLGMGELLVILLIALLFFGAKRIPEIARSLGRGIYEFKSGIQTGLQSGIQNDTKNSDVQSTNKTCSKQNIDVLKDG